MIVLILQKTNSIWEQHGKAFQKEFPEVTITDDRSLLEKAEVIITTRLTESECLQAKNLKAVIAPMAGVDTLPLDCFRRRNIRLSNVHGNIHSVAERTAALVLAWFGRIISYHQDLQQNVWHGFWIGKGTEDTWESLMGKHCSILGAGMIGKEIALRLKPFGTVVGGYRRFPSYPPQYPFDVMYGDINEAIQMGEIIISVLPATEQTRGIIGKEQIAQMKGKVLVNVGRGDVVDEQALYEGLASGILRGAALDCWYAYPTKENPNTNPSRFPFSQLSNVVLSPHIAGFTRDSMVRSITEVFENLRRFAAAGDFLYEVDLHQGY